MMASPAAFLAHGAGSPAFCRKLLILSLGPGMGTSALRAPIGLDPRSEFGSTGDGQRMVRVAAGGAVVLAGDDWRATEDVVYQGASLRPEDDEDVISGLYASPAAGRDDVLAAYDHGDHGGLGELEIA